MVGRASGKRVANRTACCEGVAMGHTCSAVFGFSGIGGGTQDPTLDFDGNGVIDEIDHFTVAEFLSVEDPPVHITTLASPALVAHAWNNGLDKIRSLRKRQGGSF